MKAKLRYGLPIAVALVCGLAAIQPAQAEDESEPDLLTQSAVAILSEGQVEEVLSDASQTTDSTEEGAVQAYIEDGPTEGSYLTTEDLEVGTVELDNGVSATVVAPEEGVDVRSVNIWGDAGSNEVGGIVELGVSESAPTTAGPGMGYWPDWADVPSYVVELRLYDEGNYVGEAEFQTQRRRYTDDGTTARDIWQVARRARATPDEFEVNNGPDLNAYVRKLYAGSNLTDDAYNYAQQWRQEYTGPDAGFSNCSGGVTINAGPFSFTPQNCEDYDVWQGRIGHQRIEYDQGAWAGGEQRAIAYVSGFQMDQGRYPYMTWYEYVTLRFGNYAGNPEITCTSHERGDENGTQLLRCDF